MTCAPYFTHANISGKQCRRHHICILKTQSVSSSMYLDLYILTSWGHLNTNELDLLIIISICVSTKTHPKVASPHLEFSHRLLTYTINKQNVNRVTRFPSLHVDVITLDSHGGADLSFGLILSIYIFVNKVVR